MSSHVNPKPITDKGNCVIKFTTIRPLGLFENSAVNGEQFIPPTPPQPQKRRQKKHFIINYCYVVLININSWWAEFLGLKVPWSGAQEALQNDWEHRVSDSFTHGQPPPPKRKKIWTKCAFTITKFKSEFVIQVNALLRSAPIKIYKFNSTHEEDTTHCSRQ